MSNGRYGTASGTRLLSAKKFSSAIRYEDFYKIVLVVLVITVAVRAQVQPTPNNKSDFIRSTKMMEIGHVNNSYQ